MELLEKAGALIGAPYLIHGRDPSGWDCFGCVGWCRAHLFGLPTPSWEEQFPEVAGLSRSALAATMERLLTERLGAWREVPARPGAVVLIKQYERRSHVGLVLTRRDFIHARRGAGTGIEGLADPLWRDRIVGFFDAV